MDCRVTLVIVTFFQTSKRSEFRAQHPIPWQAYMETCRYTPTSILTRSLPTFIPCNLLPRASRQTLRPNQSCVHESHSDCQISLRSKPKARVICSYSCNYEFYIVVDRSHHTAFQTMDCLHDVPFFHIHTNRCQGV